MCNLGSVNLVNHLKDGKLDLDKLKTTIHTAMRMLDNVVDVNYYAVGKARNSNLKHRPVGLGIMGFQDALQELRVAYASNEAVEFADRSMEAVAYYAFWASTELAQERGRYSSYEGSLWSRGILPQDSLKLLAEERGGYLEVDSSSTLDWDSLRARISQYGMRNSNCLAIAPTATIANIVGVSASIEPTYQNIYVKSNLSGEFTVANKYLVDDLKKLGLWDEVMVADIKYFDGSLAKIDRIPADIRTLYATAFEMETSWLVECASRRQKWIDQAQSLNIYMAGASGKKLDETYKLAWIRGLEDHVLPAHAGRDLGGEIHRQGRRAECRVVERRRRGDGQRQQRDQQGGGESAGAGDRRTRLHDAAGGSGVRGMRGVPVKR